MSVLDKTRSGKGGRPPISFEVKLKMLFLQYAFNLSDEELEDQLIDRLSFQEFVGLGYDEEIPDFTYYVLALQIGIDRTRTDGRNLRIDCVTD
ncbi:MAG: transposase [Pyrinomonadaceae bacterium]